MSSGTRSTKKTWIEWAGDVRPNEYGLECLFGGYHFNTLGSY